MPTPCNWCIRKMNWFNQFCACASCYAENSHAGYSRHYAASSDKQKTFKKLSLYINFFFSFSSTFIFDDDDDKDVGGGVQNIDDFTKSYGFFLHLSSLVVSLTSCMLIILLISIYTFAFQLSLHLLFLSCLIANESFKKHNWWWLFRWLCAFTPAIYFYHQSLSVHMTYENITLLLSSSWWEWKEWSEWARGR